MIQSSEKRGRFSQLAVGSIVALSAMITPLFAEDVKKESRLVVMDFGALDSLVALEREQYVVAAPQGNRPIYLSTTIPSSQNSGSLKEPNLELIQSVEPTLIVTSPRQQRAEEALEQIAPLLSFSLDREDYITSFKEKQAQLAKAVDAEEESREAVDALLKEIEQVKERAQKSGKRAVVALHNDGNIFALPESGYGRLIHQVFGVKSADEDVTEERKVVDAAYLSSVTPDLLFIIDRSAAIGATPLELDHLKEQLAKEGGLESLKIYYLTPDLWYLSGNGLMSLKMQLDEVKSAL